MSRRWLAIGLLALVMLTGCAPAKSGTATATPESLAQSIAEVTRTMAPEPPEFIGTSARASGEATVPVLYFITGSLDAFDLAEDVTLLVVELGQAKLPQLRCGFDLVMTARGGTSGVTLSFDSDTITKTDWAAVEDEFSSVNFPLIFDRAASYEWQSGSDWVSTTDPVEGDQDDRFPLKADFPPARFDDSAVLRMASELQYVDPMLDKSLAATVTVTDDDPNFRVVTISLDESPSLTWTAGYTLSTQGSYLLRRLSKDPSITNIQLNVREHAAEVCALRFSHETLARQDWESFNPYAPQAGQQIFRMAKAYRWTSEAKWRAELKAEGLSAKQLPRLNQSTRLP